MFACLLEERSWDRSPAAVFATLLDEGVYHCSVRPIHGFLEREGETGERRDQLTHPAYEAVSSGYCAEPALELGLHQADRQSGPTSISMPSWISSAGRW